MCESYDFSALDELSDDIFNEDLTESKCDHCGHCGHCDHCDHCDHTLHDCSLCGVSSFDEKNGVPIC